MIILIVIKDNNIAACRPGTNGEECDRLCPAECHYTCNKVTGECDHNPKGFTGEYCK